jgi:hypothetical protein
MRNNAIAQTIGPDAATALSLAIGGAAMAVPLSVDSPAALSLAEIIGMDGAIHLIAAFGGKQVYVPRDAEGERIQRALEIRELRRQGKTLTQISRGYRYSSRLSVRQIQNTLKGLSA